MMVLTYSHVLPVISGAQGIITCVTDSLLHNAQRCTMEAGEGGQERRYPMGSAMGGSLPNSSFVPTYWESLAQYD